MELFWKLVKLERGNIAVILLSVPAAAVLGIVISGAVCFYDEEVNAGKLHAVAGCAKLNAVPVTDESVRGLNRE